jgi:hypothetical protein
MVDFTGPTAIDDMFKLYQITSNSVNTSSEGNKPFNWDLPSNIVGSLKMLFSLYRSIYKSNRFIDCYLKSKHELSNKFNTQIIINHIIRNGLVNTGFCNILSLLR